MICAESEIQIVTLGLGEEVFGASVSVVREILDYRRPSGVPDAPAYFVGLTDVRGQGVPTLDLRTKLGLPAVPPGPLTRILVVDVPVAGRTLSLGLIADRVIEVLSLQRNEVEPAPEIGLRWRSDYIEGVVRRDDGFIILFDLRHLLTSSEQAVLDHAA